MNTGEIIALQGQAPRNVGVPSIKEDYLLGKDIAASMTPQAITPEEVDKISKLSNVDASKYSAPRRELAKQEADAVLGEVWGKYNELEKQKKGAGAAYMRSAEAVQKLSDLQRKLNTLQTQSAKDFEFQKGYEKGDIVGDPELYRVLTQGAADDLRKYKNEAFGTTVTPELDVNYMAGKPVDVRKSFQPLLSNQYAYTEETGRRGGYSYNKIPDRVIEAEASSLALEPDTQLTYYKKSPKRFNELYQKNVADANAKGLPVDQDALRVTTTKQMIVEEMSGLAKPLLKPMRLPTGGRGATKTDKVDIPTDYFNRLVDAVAEINKKPSQYEGEKAYNLIAQNMGGKVVKKEGGVYRVVLPSTLVQGKESKFDISAGLLKDPKTNKMYKGHKFNGIVNGSIVGEPQIAWYNASGKEVPANSTGARAYFRVDVQPTLDEEFVASVPKSTWEKLGVADSDPMTQINKFKTLLSSKGTFVMSYPVDSEDARSFLSQTAYQGTSRESQFNTAIKQGSGGTTTVQSKSETKPKQKTYKAAELNDKVVAEIKENEIVVIDGVERIKQGGVLKKVKR